MKIVFMGTPDFSVLALDALVDAGHEIVCVYSQPPRPAGRGKADRKTPVHERAEALGLPVRTPLNFKESAEVDAFSVLSADIAVVVAYGLLLPQAVLDAPAKGCLNIHASLLPRWRGAAPIQRAIMAGDEETGVCIMQMEAGLDTGPVLFRRTLDRLQPATQSEVGVTYAKKIDKAEARIDWSRSAREIDRQIRGLSPFPGAWSELGDQRIKLLMSREVPGEGEPGRTLDDELTIATGQGAVKIDRLQRAGKASAHAADLLRGYPIPKGTSFR